MSRRKGERRPKDNERDFPHIVETVTPVLEVHEDYVRWRLRFDAMNDWHAARNLYPRHGRRRVAIYEHIRWCFADAATAEAFKAEFGGEIVNSPTKPQL